MSTVDTGADSTLRRSLKALALLGATGAVAGGAWMATRPPPTAPAALEIAVYKSPSCGCCHGWIEHLEEHGFVVTTHDTPEMDEVKARLGVPPQLTSCHTAVVDGYTTEGHIPADVIRDLVEERPAVLGIGVRGMPLGSPGMEQGGRTERYAVMAFTADGQTSVFARR